MGNKRFVTIVVPLVALVALLLGGPAPAGELYVTGNLGISGATGESSGSTDFFAITGSDQDSSPIYGTSLGIAMPLNELIPTGWDDRLRHWRINMPTWDVRFEVEGVLGRDYELRTKGGDGYFTEVDAWAVTHNMWMDMPIHGAFEWAFGRVPILEPVTFYMGTGIGLGITRVKTTDNVSKGKDMDYRFAWQVGGGFGYKLTEYVTLNAGYRYQDLGTAKIELDNGGTEPFGTYKLAVTAHEATTGVRFHFYAVPFPNWGE